MKTLEKVSDFVGKYMAAIVIVVAALALLFPGPFSVVKTAWVNTLLGIVMFGMGLTLKPEDFKVVFSRPKDVIIGCIAQFTLMPFLAWALTQLFHLPTELAIGVILVGTCPGGTSSNVMTYLSKGDVALSVGMTAVSTVLAPFLTPLLTLLYAGQRVNVNPVKYPNRHLRPVPRHRRGGGHLPQDLRALPRHRPGAHQPAHALWGGAVLPDLRPLRRHRQNCGDPLQNLRRQGPGAPPQEHRGDRARRH